MLQDNKLNKLQSLEDKPKQPHQLRQLECLDLHSHKLLQGEECLGSLLHLPNHPVYLEELTSLGALSLHKLSNLQQELSKDLVNQQILEILDNSLPKRSQMDNNFNKCKENNR